MSSLASNLSDVVNQSGRKHVAVVDFTDLQGCVTELGRYMAEDISVALVNSTKGFEVIDRTNLKILLQEHKLASTGIIDPVTARKLGQIAGVEALVTGTIAPLSDSVHVSAKVLDTESAKVLGGITADIPKTRTVEELLAKGVANCDQPSIANADVLRTPDETNSTIQRPQALASGQIGDFIISIVTCRRSGERVQCTGSVVNKGRDRQFFKINELSYIVDNLGNQSDERHDYARVKVAIGSGGQAQEMEPDLALNISISGLGLSDKATSVSIVIGASSSKDGSQRVTLKNMPIQER